MSGPCLHSGAYRAATGITWMTAWILASLTVAAQTTSDDPVADVFAVMALADDSRMDILWPGFRPRDIPVLVFDGRDTYLFHAPSAPEGFAPTAPDPGVFIHPGRHPLVRGNSVARLGEGWVATSVLAAVSKRTGEAYASKDLAGIIVHEQFHVFQRTRHPRWRPNDGVLLRYPAETAEALALRRLEKEAFRRAVTAAEPAAMAGWARQALHCRQERLGPLPEPFVTYEKELQRTEGLSDYIERMARRVDPLDASNITDGIAPAGVRDLGYWEGRWIAMILDALQPDWKARLEADDRLYLEELLVATLGERPEAFRAFSQDERDAFQAEAQADLAAWQARKADELARNDAAPGYRLEIRAAARPLAIRLFEPLAMEILDDGGVYHRLVFVAGADGGSLRIMNHPSLTWFDGSLRVVRVCVHGLQLPPEIREDARRLVVRQGDVSIELSYARLTVEGDRFIVEM